MLGSIKNSLPDSPSVWYSGSFSKRRTEKQCMCACPCVGEKTREPSALSKNENSPRLLKHYSDRAGEVWQIFYPQSSVILLIHTVLGRDVAWECSFQHKMCVWGLPDLIWTIHRLSISPVSLWQVPPEKEDDLQISPHVSKPPLGGMNHPLEMPPACPGLSWSSHPSLWDACG